MQRVKVISKTKQEFLDEVYYLCGNYFQKDDKRLHRAVWEFYNDEIPDKFHVHHKKSKYDNNIEDLTLLSEFEHLSFHGYKQKRNSFPKECIEESKKWHKTKRGKEFHRKHYEETKEN
jgi:hypothetical protein